MKSTKNTLKCVASLLGLLTASSAFATFGDTGANTLTIPGNLAAGSYATVNGSGNKATAAGSGGVTSFKKGFHMGYGSIAIQELDVEIKKRFYP